MCHTNSNHDLKHRPLIKQRQPSISLLLFLILIIWPSWNSYHNGVMGADILIIHPLYSGSHVLTLRSVAESLVARGHHVHVVRWRDMHYFPAVSNENITESLLAMNNEDGRWQFLTQEKNAAFMMPYEILWNSGLSYKSIVEASEAFPLMEAQCETLLSNTELVQKLKGMKFSLAIIDILYNECGLVLLNHLKIPAVGYWAFPFSSGEADYTTAFLPASHVPAFMSRMTHVMSFKERVYNVLMKLGSHLTMQIHCFYVNRAVQSKLPGTPNPCDLIGDVSGMLINTDYAMDYPRLLPPTFINVGGMQIRSPKPLPDEIEEWMQNSGEHGVVLFTMGFIFNPKVVPKRLVNAFMEAFSRLPQKFLVKFEGPIDFIPPNVKVLEWIPQQDVLSHNKTRLFLTHCGLHGVMEGIYYGIPMVGMPIFIDQGDALIKMEELGIALGLDKETATADEIHHQLKRVLNEPKFQENVKRLSHLMRDVKEPPLERAIDLIHYMIRHKGAPHLKLASRSLNFVQYFSIDAVAFLAIIFLCLCYLQFLMFKKVISIIILVFRGLAARTGYRNYRILSYLGLQSDFATRIATNSADKAPSFHNNNNNLNNFTNNSSTRSDTTNVKTFSNSFIDSSERESRSSSSSYNLRHQSSNGGTSFSQVVNHTSLHQKKRD